MWRLRAELPDRPGALARLTASLAAQDCNILALTVLPVLNGVVDDLVISTPEDCRPADLVTLIRAVGGRCAGITKAEPTDLTDAPAAALRVAAQLANGTITYPEAVRELLAADSVEPTEDTDSTDRQVILDGLRIRRGWAPFTEVELSRTTPLAELAAVVGADAEPRAIVTADGAGVVLRAGQPGDTDAMAAMHDRCTPIARTHTGPRSMAMRLLRKPLTQPRGQTVVALAGFQVIAIGQLINTNDPAVAEVSVLVEDDWRGKGLGSAVLTQLSHMARAAGHRELIGRCDPNDDTLLRAATNAGISARTTRQTDLLRITLES